MTTTCLRTILILSSFALAGCANTAAQYVEMHTGGNFVVRGTVVGMEDLSTSKWEQLSDGVALRTDQAGCVVVVEQELNEGGSEQTRFELIAGDHIIVTGDGNEGDDYLISSLRNNVGIDVEPAGQR